VWGLNLEWLGRVRCGFCDLGGDRIALGEGYDWRRGLMRAMPRLLIIP
jgi:hypothetical protein